METEKTGSNFIQKAQAVHGNKYNYSMVEYTTNKNKVHIICPEHGGFWQRPYSHLRGVGCPICGRLKANKAETDTRDIFIQKAKLVHGDKYDYGKVEYINSQTKVTIICPEHGEFIQAPAMHLSGNGCPKCGRIYARKANTFSADTFIAKAKKVHGTTYDYSKVQYVNSRTKVILVCPEHGEFLQAPHKHLLGQGCPKCGFLNAIAKRGKQND